MMIVMSPLRVALALLPVLLAVGCATTSESSRSVAGESTENKRTVEKYMEGFRKGDHVEILSCLTDDVVWDLPGAYHLVGKAAFDKEIENDAFVGKPTITITRVLEEHDVVAAEGAVRVQRKAGGFLEAKFCDVFAMEHGKIAHLISYLIEVK